jgi:hypothetical protein
VTSAGQHLSSAAAVVLAALKSAGVRVALPHDGVITERAGEERQRSSQVGPSRNFIYHRFVQLVPKSLRVSLFWLMGRGSVSISAETTMNSYREHVQAMKCLAGNTGSLVYTMLTHAGIFEPCMIDSWINHDFFFATNIIIIIICCYNVFFVTNTLLIGSNVYWHKQLKREHSSRLQSENPVWLRLAAGSQPTGVPSLLLPPVLIRIYSYLSVFS